MMSYLGIFWSLENIRVLLGRSHPRSGCLGRRQLDRERLSLLVLAVEQWQTVEVAAAVVVVPSNLSYVLRSISVVTVTGCFGLPSKQQCLLVVTRMKRRKRTKLALLRLRVLDFVHWTKWHLIGRFCISKRTRLGWSLELSQHHGMSKLASVFAVRLVDWLHYCI